MVKYRALQWKTYYSRDSNNNKRNHQKSVGITLKLCLGNYENSLIKSEKSVHSPVFATFSYTEETLKSIIHAYTKRD